MRIMCLNAWGGRMHAALLPYLAQATPDVLCLQEVIHSPATAKPELTYRDENRVLPQRTNLFAEVQRALPGYHATFCPAAQGVLWDGEVAVPSQWGLASYVHPRLAVIGQVQGFVHKDFSPEGYGAHPRSRAAHGVRLWDFEAGRAVAVTQMHGTWDPRGKLDTPERAAQARALLALAQSLAAPGDLQVICGDFNVLPGSETLQILERAGFTELVLAGGFEGTRSSVYTKPGRFADYMLVDDPGAVRGFEVVRDPEVSDHCPLVLTV
jgi:endonuclease/exonuclease/phosphatase family metal-dependent hydrolase